MKRIIISKLFNLLILIICISMVCTTALAISFGHFATNLVNNEYYASLFSEIIKDNIDDITNTIPDSIEDIIPTT